MESKLAGIIVIILVLSAAGVLSVAVMRRERSVVVMLQNDYPTRLMSIEREGKHFAFAHGYLARQEIAELEIRFSLLHSSPEPQLLNNESGFSFTDYLELDVFNQYLGNPEFVLADEFEVKLQNGGKTIHLFDVSPSVHPFASPRSANYVSSIFGYIEEGEGNRSFLRGISDFFYEREHNIEYLVISHGANETSYSSAETAVYRIVEAPRGGLVTFRNLKKGDMAVVGFSVVPHKDHMPERTWSKNYDRTIYQIIRVYANGELLLVKANKIEVDLV